MNRALAKLSALALVALILTPFTAPFQTFELGVPESHHRGILDVAATLTSDDEAGSVITQAIAFGRWKLVLLADAHLGAKISSVLSTTVAAPRRPFAAPRDSSGFLSTALRL